MKINHLHQKYIFTVLIDLKQEMSTWKLLCWWHLIDILWICYKYQTDIFSSNWKNKNKSFICWSWFIIDPGYLLSTLHLIFIELPKLLSSGGSNLPWESRCKYHTQHRAENVRFFSENLQTSYIQYGFANVLCGKV